MDTWYCEKCRQTMNVDEFYISNNLEKYPQGGKINQCKKCMTMHVDNWDPDTYLWILEEIDVPYVPDEWNKLMNKYARDSSKITGKTIIGRYLSKMKLKQFKDYRWKDSEYLQEQAKAKIEQTMKRQGYDAQEINQVINTAVIPIPEKPAELAPVDSQQIDPFNLADDDMASDLTEEDITYLRLKWGRTYRQSEWVQLEQLYEEMMASYDIQAAGDINTLKLACKCSLKANQLLDLGDIDGAQKATKMYDGLMKSGKWTAAQNKVTNEEFVDSIGELAAICERDGFIPKYYTTEPQDHADRVIEDLQKYTSDLIMNESGLAQMIELAVKQISEENDRIKEAAEMSDEDNEAKLFNYDEKIIEPQDFSDFKDFQDDLSEEDQAFYDSLLEED